MSTAGYVHLTYDEVTDKWNMSGASQ